MRPAVYRHFDDNGNLLYVGFSIYPVVRQYRHRTKGWFDLVTRIEIEHVTSTIEARAREKAAIRSERPKYNIFGLEKAAVSTIGCDAMNLTDYIRQSGVDAFAARFGFNPRTVKSWMYGQRRPRPAIAARIVQETPVTWEGVHGLERAKDGV